MQGHILRVRDLGHEGFWRVLHEASAPPAEAPALRRHAVLLHGEGESSAASWLETSVLCQSALTRCDGTLHCVDLPPALASALPLMAQGPLYQACADLCLTHGLPDRALDILSAACQAPLLNMGNASSHPCAALADLSLLQRQDPTLENTRIAWVGGINGLGHALMEAAIYAPFELFMAVPAWGEPQHDIAAVALKAGAKIFLTREPHMALDEAHIVYAGAGPEGNTLEAGMPLTEDLLVHARPGAQVITGQSLGCGCRVDDNLCSQELEGQRSASRLRVLQSLLGTLAG